MRRLLPFLILHVSALGVAPVRRLPPSQHADNRLPRHHTPPSPLTSLLALEELGLARHRVLGRGGRRMARLRLRGGERRQHQRHQRHQYPSPHKDAGIPDPDSASANRHETARIVPPTKKMELMGAFNSATYGKPEPLPKGSAYMQPDYPSKRYEYEYAKGVHDVDSGTAPHQFPWAMDYKCTSWAQRGDACCLIEGVVARCLELRCIAACACALARARSSYPDPTACK